MRDTRTLTETETRVRYLMEAATPDEIHELATLALMATLVHRDAMSPAARDTFDGVLRTIGPDFLLTFRALRQVARRVTDRRPNWRKRT